MRQHVNMYPRLFLLKIGITFLATMNDPWTIRNNRRDVFITGVSKKGVPFDEKEKDKDAWDIENINPLLDAHYECARPGKPHVIADVLMMLDEEKGGHAQISVHGARKAKQTPRKLGPIQLLLIQEWFDVKKHEGDEAFQHSKRSHGLS